MRYVLQYPFPDKYYKRKLTICDLAKEREVERTHAKARCEYNPAKSYVKVTLGL